MSVVGDFNKLKVKFEPLSWGSNPLSKLQSTSCHLSSFLNLATISCSALKYLSLNIIGNSCWRATIAEAEAAALITRLFHEGSNKIYLSELALFHYSTVLIVRSIALKALDRPS